MASKSFDIKLNGKRYMFGATPGIQLGTQKYEPGGVLEPATLSIDTLHGGIGRSMAKGILNYKQALYADCTIPGEVLPGYGPFPIGDGVGGTPLDTGLHTGVFTATGTVLSRPTFAYIPTDINDHIFVLGGQIAQVFDPENPGVGMRNVLVWQGVHEGEALSSIMGTNREFSGSSFGFGGTQNPQSSQIIFGIIRNDTDHLYEPSAHLWARPDGDITVVSGGMTLGTRKISYGASGRNRAFWIDFVGDVASLKWAPFELAVTIDGSSQIQPADPATGINLGMPRIAWMTMLGKSLVLSRVDGALIGADEQGILNVAGQATIAGADAHFGRRACNYQDGLLFGGKAGLWSYDIHSLTMRPAGFNFVQNQAEERLRGEITAVGAAGPYGFVGLTRTVKDEDTTLHQQGWGYMLVRYANQIAVHDLIIDLAEDEIITDFLPYYQSAGRRTILYYLVFNTVTLEVKVMGRPLALPTDQTAIGNESITSGFISLSPIAGPAPAANVSKVWTQVRGHFEKGTGPDLVGKLQFSGFKIDGKAVSIADVTATGSFAVPITAAPGDEVNLLGREISEGTLVLAQPDHDTRLTLPLMFDYFWNPGMVDSLTLSLLVSGHVEGRVSAAWEHSPWATTKDLLELDTHAPEIIDLEFPEGDVWRVIVKDVKILDSVPPDHDMETARIAQVELIRVA